MDKVITSLTVLLTGFVVVFLVLFLLIGIIMLYSSIVRAAEGGTKKKEKKIEKPAEEITAQPAQQEEAPVSDGEIPEEIIAVIAAAVDSMYGAGASSRIKSVKKTASSRSAWGNAGVFQNTRPF